MSYFDVDELNEIEREQTLIKGQIESERQIINSLLLAYKTNILSAFELYVSMVREFPIIANKFGKEPFSIITSNNSPKPKYTVPVYPLNNNPHLYVNRKGDLLCISSQGSTLTRFTTDDCKRLLDEWIKTRVKVNPKNGIVVWGEPGFLNGLTQYIYNVEILCQAFDYQEYRLKQIRSHEDVLEVMKKYFISQARNLDFNRPSLSNSNYDIDIIF